MLRLSLKVAEVMRDYLTVRGARDDHEWRPLAKPRPGERSGSGGCVAG